MGPEQLQEAIEKIQNSQNNIKIFTADSAEIGTDRVPDTVVKNDRCARLAPYFMNTIGLPVLRLLGCRPGIAMTAGNHPKGTGIRNGQISQEIPDFCVQPGQTTIDCMAAGTGSVSVPAHLLG